MGPKASEPVTELLLRWSAGDRDCLNELIPLMGQELRRMAHRHMPGERPGHTLQTSALVNEAWLKLLWAPAFGRESGPSFETSGAAFRIASCRRQDPVSARVARLCSQSRRSRRAT
jgi:hypothetical protein